MTHSWLVTYQDGNADKNFAACLYLRCVTMLLHYPLREGSEYIPCSQNAVMSAAQSTTVHDGLLHPHLRHCSSPASAVSRLPSAVCTATPALHVRSSGLFCGRPSGLELVIGLPARYAAFLGQFSPGPENFSFLVLL